MFFAKLYSQKEKSVPAKQAAAPVCYSGIQFDRLCRILSLNRCHQSDLPSLKH